MKTTIQKKLVSSVMKVVVSAFVIVIAIVATINIINSQKSLASTTQQIKKSLEAKGKILVQNNSLAMSGMVGDNAYSSVQELVFRTVQDDPDVVYGIFMDANNQAWINSKDGDTTSQSTSPPATLEDAISKWAAEQTKLSFKEIPTNPVPTIEFCNPVKVDGEIAGFIRYGLSTKALVEAATQARTASIQTMLTSLVILVLLGIVAVLASFFLIKRESIRLSSPIIQLGKEAKVIAEGNYNNAVQVESDDEIGALATSFEEMRQKIKLYTDHLEELIAEKMRQVRDILDNIDQGLFTVNFDGTINEEYSRAATQMLLEPELHKSNIQKLLRFGAADSSDWKDWIDIVSARHASMRWEKLLKIAPVRELEIVNESGERTILSFGFQKIFDKQGQLIRLMVLVQDVTESRRIERIVREEQQKHENEVRTILGLVNNIPEVIADFFRDIDDRIELIHTNLGVLKQEAQKARTEFPNVDPKYIDQGIVAAIFRDLHTIKGNAASYGFEAMSHIAHSAEESLEALRPPIKERVLDTLSILFARIDDMKVERSAIENTSQMLRGGQDNIMISINEHKITHIQRLAQTLLRESTSLDSSPYLPLIQACNQLRQVSVGKLAEKYAKMVVRVADSLGKKIVFTCKPFELEVDPVFFLSFNESLIHILRNSVDHGIEMPEDREQAGKLPEGHINLEIQSVDNFYVLTIQDDGKGIDPDRLAQKAYEKGLISASDLNSLSKQQKLELIYLSGFSTKDEVSDVSGRGVGMDAVKNGIEALGGKIYLSSEFGKGTKIQIEVPAQAIQTS